VDTKRGIFYWQPGVGFFGEHRLVFIERGNAGGMKKRLVRIKITPKF
jgi:hypothetical protein